MCAHSVETKKHQKSACIPEKNVLLWASLNFWEELWQDIL